jgi:acyl carrier protein phosphodiesterase
VNYLGHLFFSNDDPNLMYANLFGDFVKGKEWESMRPEIRYGILLHRKIDNYIDHHPQVQALMHTLYDELPKISGIAVDLYFDHLLARNWSDYHPLPLEDFVEKFFAHPVDRADYPKDEFWFVMDKIHEGDWILNYRFHHGLEFACYGLSRRISFPNVLHKAPTVFLAHEAEIERCFRSFMEDALLFFAKEDS